MKTVTLGSGASYPLLGLGTWQAKPNELESALMTALDIGYRHIDTAFNYNNEETIGKIVKKWLELNNRKRNELFITTKLPNFANRSGDVERLLKLSLERLGLEYVDLYLIHVPFGFQADETNLGPKIDSEGNFQLDLNVDHADLWKEMESMMKKGLAKNIGLSNFNQRQIERIYSSADVKPHVLQVECHAYMQQRSLRAFCAEKNIILTAYSPLGSRGSLEHFKNKYNHTLKNLPDVLGDAALNRIARNHSKTPAQIILNYFVAHNLAVIPKSSNPERLRQNYEIFDFELAPNEIDEIKSLDMDAAGRIIDFHFWKGAEQHPEYPF